MPLILGAQSATAVTQKNSCRFNNDDGAYLSDTPSAGNLDLWTYSMWFKRCSIGVDTPLFTASPTSSTEAMTLTISATDVMDWSQYDSGYEGRLVTNRVFRDLSAWMHVVAVWDSANGAGGDRMRIYINGVEETSFSTDTNPTSGQDSLVNSAIPQVVGGQIAGPVGFDGYLAEVYFIDGTAYGPTDFGEFDSDSPSIWKPKDASGLTFGSNGFYFNFEDSADLGADVSGNGNDFTATSLTAEDQGTDTPVNNFATLNPLTVDTGGAKTYSEGNTTVAETANSWTSAHSSLAVAAGKWYFESKFNLTASTEGYFGCASVPEINDRADTTFYLGSGASIGYYTTDGNVDKGGVSSSYGNVVTTGQIMGLALDITNELAYFAINGTWQNSADPVAGSGGVSFPSGMTDGEFICLSVSPNESYWECNFGGSSGFTVSSGNADGNGYGNFEYAPPTGYLALCTKNIGSDGG